MPVCCLCHRVCSARGHAYPHRRVSLAPTGSSQRFTRVYCLESGLSFPLPWVWARDFHFTRTACNIKHPFRAGAHVGMQTVISAIRLSEINCGLDHLRASSAVLEVASWPHGRKGQFQEQATKPQACECRTRGHSSVAAVFPVKLLGGPGQHPQELPAFLWAHWRAGTVIPQGVWAAAFSSLIFYMPSTKNRGPRHQRNFVRHPEGQREGGVAKSFIHHPTFRYGGLLCVLSSAP